MSLITFHYSPYTKSSVPCLADVRSQPDPPFLSVLCYQSTPIRFSSSFHGKPSCPTSGPSNGSQGPAAVLGHFAKTGRPNSPRYLGLPAFPPYGDEEQVINLGPGGITDIHDPVNVERCDWWEEGLYLRSCQLRIKRGCWGERSLCGDMGNNSRFGNIKRLVAFLSQECCRHSEAPLGNRNLRS